MVTVLPGSTSTSRPAILSASALGPVTVTPNLPLSGSDAVGVVGMMVGDEDVGQRPAAAVGGRFDGGGVGRVDGGGLAGRLVVREIADIVLAAGEGIRRSDPWCFPPACGCGTYRQVRRPCDDPGRQAADRFLQVAAGQRGARAGARRDRPHGGRCRGPCACSASALQRRTCGSRSPEAERVLAFMPARQGSSAWPREGPSHTVLCDPLEMPLTDAAVDLSSRSMPSSTRRTPRSRCASSGG